MPKHLLMKIMIPAGIMTAMTVGISTAAQADDLASLRSHLATRGTTISSAGLAGRETSCGHVAMAAASYMSATKGDLRNPEIFMVDIETHGGKASVLVRRTWYTHDYAA